jgi:hypothetical protein
MRLSSTDLCMPRAGATAAAAYPDGADGIDDAFGAHVLPIRDLAPGLVSDAARESDGRPAVILEQALTMLRGNRSSTLTTYFTRDGALRAVFPGSTPFSPDAEAQHLARVTSLLDRTVDAWLART